MLAISNDELDRARPVNNAEPCPKCGELAEVYDFGGHPVTIHVVKHCGANYVVGINGKKVDK